MILPLIKAPNELLTTPAAPVTEFNNALRTLADDMIESMYAYGGIGLAANQVGSNKQLFVVDLKPKGKKSPLVFINPTMTYSGKYGTRMKEEGCLSLPGERRTLPRWRFVTVDYQDIEGKKRQIFAIDDLAHVIQHEMDHLNGYLI